MDSKTRKISERKERRSRDHTQKLQHYLNKFSKNATEREMKAKFRSNEIK